MARINRRRVGPLLVAADGRTPLTAVMWRCSKCREPKPESAFVVTDGRTGRRRAACKDCENLRLRVRAARDGERRTVRVSAPGDGHRPRPAAGVRRLRLLLRLPARRRCLMAYFVPCDDCHGERVLDGEPCVYCDGEGYVEERLKTDAELKAEVRFIERFLSEPGYEMAFLFLLDQKAARHRAAIERAALGKAA